jgi:hypothetical protein
MFLSLFANYIVGVSLLFSVPTLAASGDVVCRYTGTTPERVNYYTCTELAVRYRITVELFFTLNPKVDKDCRNIEATTAYCVKGCKFFYHTIRRVGILLKL